MRSRWVRHEDDDRRVVTYATWIQFFTKGQAEATSRAL